MTASTYSRPYLRVVFLTALFAINHPVPDCQAQSYSWMNTSGGFYEGEQNWLPTGVPGPANATIFGRPESYHVGLLGDVANAGLIAANDTDVTFGIGGTSTNDRSFTIDGDTSIDNAMVTFGSSTGPSRLNVSISGDLKVDGYYSGSTDGMLRIRDNVTLASQSATLGTTPNSFGQVSVSGAGASWELPDGHLIVGSSRSGGGQLTVESGASVNAAIASIAMSPLNEDRSNTGLILVSGVGTDGIPSTWSTRGKAIIGDQGKAFLHVNGGANATNETVRVAVNSSSRAEIEIAGTDAAGNPSTWVTGNMATSEFGGYADLAIEDGAKVLSEKVILGGHGGASVKIGGTDAFGQPASWVVSDDLMISSGATVFLDVRSGGNLSSGTTYVGASNDSKGILLAYGQDADRPATWQSSGHVYVGGGETASGGEGRVELIDFNRTDIAGRMKIWNSGNVLVKNAFLAVDILDHTEGGLFEFQSGTLQVKRFEGDLVNQGGVLAPGPDTSSTTILGDYKQEAGGMMTFEIGGSSPGGTHDLVNIVGNADLDGQLQLSLANGFVPESDDEFTLLGAEGIVGIFDNIAAGQRLSTVDGQGSFEVNYGIGSSFDENRLVVSNFIPNSFMLRAGDADQDLDFDQLDLVKVQVANKYLSGAAATWGEGDWDGAPGGSTGNPPSGDGLFNQLDIIAANLAGVYLQGPYAAIQVDGTIGDGQTSLVYDAGTGELSVDAPSGQELTSINVTSAASRFVGSHPAVLDGAFDNFAADNVFKATFGGSFGDISFGNVLPAGLSEVEVAADLSAVGSLAGGGDLGDVDVVYVPEPASVVLFLGAFLTLCLRAAQPRGGRVYRRGCGDTL